MHLAKCSKREGFVAGSSKNATFHPIPLHSISHTFQVGGRQNGASRTKYILVLIGVAFVCMV